MDTLMFDSHHDAPEWIFPRNRKRQRQGADQAVHHVTNLIAILLDLPPGRPVVMGLIQVIPGHFVHPDGKH